MPDIELVIKIPDEEYRWIKGSDKTVFADVASKECMLHAIKNGTPLPKGHGELIDRDYLREDFKASKKISFAERMDISCIVDHAPTIIEADKEGTI